MVENGLSLPKTDILVSEFAEAWLARRLNGKPLSSWESDETRLRLYIVPEFGNREMNKMYNDGLREEAVSTNPVRAIPKLKESMEAWDYWASVDEIMSYLTEAKNESASFYMFACLSLNLGTRIGEILALDHSDLNLQHRRIHIAKIFEETSGQVFRRTKTYASHYIMNGGSLVELQSLLGHSSPTMTLKYAHLAPGYLEKKASVVSFSLPKENVFQLRKIK